MKIKDLSGEALNYAVCVAEGNGGKLSTEGFVYYLHEGSEFLIFPDYLSWADGGPIIERKCITITAYGEASDSPKNPDYWEACIHARDETIVMTGSSPLEAAMRCYVAYKFGDEVEIPEELR